jgi:hypothetical protein
VLIVGGGNSAGQAELLGQIRTLVREVNRENGAHRASRGAQTREIERLKLALADWVKRNPI